ncbi:19891_t:CDS:1, partial [Racocetra fulgida]
SPRQLSVSQDPFKNSGETLHPASQSSRPGFSRQSTESASKNIHHSSTNDPSPQLSRPGFSKRPTDPIPKKAPLSTTITDPEKLRKMQALEEILASSDAKNERKVQKFENVMAYTEHDGKKARVGKNRTLKTAIITSTTAMASPSVIPVEPITSTENNNNNKIQETSSSSSHGQENVLPNVVSTSRTSSPTSLESDYYEDEPETLEPPRGLIGDD